MSSQDPPGGPAARVGQEPSPPQGRGRGSLPMLSRSLRSASRCRHRRPGASGPRPPARVRRSRSRGRQGPSPARSVPRGVSAGLKASLFRPRHQSISPGRAVATDGVCPGGRDDLARGRSRYRTVTEVSPSFYLGRVNCYPTFKRCEWGNSRGLRGRRSA
jgi:hypothetical protein